MSGLCKDCSWWKRSKEWGTCGLAWSHNGERIIANTKAVAEDWGSYKAALLTAPDFGCVQFEAKEE